LIYPAVDILNAKPYLGYETNLIRDMVCSQSKRNPWEIQALSQFCFVSI